MTKNFVPTTPKNNKYGHHWGHQTHLGHAICDWCNAVQNTKEAITKCPMATLTIGPNDTVIWLRKSKYGGWGKGFGKYGSGSRFFKYPKPSPIDNP